METKSLIGTKNKKGQVFTERAVMMTRRAPHALVLYRERSHQRSHQASQHRCDGGLSDHAAK